MQAGVEPENLKRSVVSNPMDLLESTSGLEMEVQMQDAVTAKTAHSDSDTRVLTRAQRKRRRAEKSHRVTLLWRQKIRQAISLLLQA